MLPILVQAESAFIAEDTVALQIRPQEQREADWVIDAGVGTLVKPDYSGSDDYEFSFLPFLDIKYKNFFLSPKRGLGAYLFRKEGWGAGTSLNFGGGRDTDQNARLSGLDETDTSMQGEVFVNYRWKIIKLDATLTRDLTEGYDGFTSRFSAGTGAPLGDTGAFARVGIFTTLANSHTMRAFYGVSNDESTRSVYAPHKASTGFQDAGVHVGVTQQLAEGFSLNAMVTYTRLVKDAADSPIVQDEDQWSGGAFLTYSFK